MTNEAFPLEWPPGWQRTERREQSTFRTTKAAAKKQLLRELTLLGARDVVITSDVVRRRDGEESRVQPKQVDPAVAVWFTLRGEERCIPCDKWTTLADNLHAIELTVAALRGLERWGAKEMVNAAFRGFTAALPMGGSGASCWEVLGIEPGANASTIDAAYRAKAKELHPDKGGDAESFHALQAAYSQAKGTGA